MKVFLIFIIFTCLSYAQEDQQTQGFVEVVNPSLEIDPKLKKQNEDLIFKHANQKNKKKLIPVNVREDFISFYKLEVYFTQENFDELDKDNFFRRVEYYDEDKLLEFYPFAKHINLNQIKQAIHDYRGKD